MFMASSQRRSGADAASLFGVVAAIGLPAAKGAFSPHRIHSWRRLALLRLVGGHVRQHPYGHRGGATLAAELK
jgi:hypothetical protein